MRRGFCGGPRGSGGVRGGSAGSRLDSHGGSRPIGTFAPVSIDDGHEWWLNEPPAPEAEPGSLDQVRQLLAGIPHGTYVMTSAHDGARSGVLVRWVQPAAANPPMVSVAFPRGSAVAALVCDSRRFALCRLAEGDRYTRLKFAEVRDPRIDPFLGLPVRTTPGGLPLPGRAVTYLDCRLAFNLDLEADCGFYVGRVMSGAALRRG